MTPTLLPVSELHLPGQTDKLFSHLPVPPNIFFRAPSEQITTKFQVRVETKHHKYYMHAHTNVKLHFSTDSSWLEDL